MLAKYEKRTYVGSEHVWVGKYRNLHNISHWHLEHELIVCCQGSARVMIDDRLFTVHGGGSVPSAPAVACITSTPGTMPSC